MSPFPLILSNDFTCTTINFYSDVTYVMCACSQNVGGTTKQPTSRYNLGTDPSSITVRSEVRFSMVTISMVGTCIYFIPKG